VHAGAIRTTFVCLQLNSAQGRQTILGQFRTIQLAAIGLIVLATVTVLGLVWVSVGLVRALGPALPQAAPELLVGVLFLAPAAIFALVHVLTERAERRQAALAQQAAAAQNSNRDDISKLADIARGYAEQSPILALAIAATAGFVAVRYPNVLSIMTEVMSGLDSANRERR